ncbi:hypothetical protein PLEOSDRAFT_1071068 [Pleurotus ostreatus PC15]|uniref:Uncharacterized protein n=1 Tax=Pleurotus ostreatus (strain PC15) TaxID=1137138 RepID=A0A067NSB5_PLEO1|nr:hypothetical protein PLEOSDRAFT_1071068 [Pleurotus ostreatus PC15]
MNIRAWQAVSVVIYNISFHVQRNNSKIDYGRTNWHHAPRHDAMFEMRKERSSCRKILRPKVVYEEIKLRLSDGHEVAATRDQDGGEVGVKTADLCQFNVGIQSPDFFI